MRRTDAIFQEYLQKPIKEDVYSELMYSVIFKSLVLPLSRAKRGGEEEGRKLDPFELSRSHYGCMKSRVGCRIGSKK